MKEFGEKIEEIFAPVQRQTKSTENVEFLLIFSFG